MLLAQEARSQLDLDRVVMVPTGRAPHKRIEDNPGADVRLELTRCAAAGEPGMEVSAIEVEGAAHDPKALSYTYLTLESLVSEYPGGELFLLIGADMATTLASWEKPERVVELARIAVVPRPGVELSAARSGLESVGAADRSEILDMPQCSVSSTLIRKRASEGKPLRHLVPEAVIELITARGLYR